MRVSQEFDRFAYTYQKHNHIQREVAKELISMLPRDIGDRYIDIGSGDGAVYRALKYANMNIEKFIAIDISPTMLKLHPNSKKIEKIVANFDTIDKSNILDSKSIDIVVSASSLQWSQDINRTIKSLSNLAPYGAFAIFTDATFKDLLNYLNVPSPILSLDNILDALLNSYSMQKLHIQNIKMPFKSNIDMLTYIKKSGVSGGRSILGYKDIKSFINSYDNQELDFQIVYFVGKSLNSSY